MELTLMISFHFVSSPLSQDSLQMKCNFSMFCCSRCKR